jgi:hypothetical protein
VLDSTSVCLWPSLATEWSIGDQAIVIVSEERWKCSQGRWACHEEEPMNPDDVGRELTSGIPITLIPAVSNIQRFLAK